MTYFEKIKEYVERNDKKSLGRLICNITDEKNEDCCTTCPTRDNCWENHNGWIALMDKEYKNENL